MKIIEQNIIQLTQSKANFTGGGKNQPSQFLL